MRRMSQANIPYNFLRDEEAERIMSNHRRNWARHPELKAQYGTFSRYLCSVWGTSYGGTHG